MKIQEELQRRCPDMDISRPFGEWAWGSLEWAEFLNVIMERFPAEKKEQAVEELFIRKNFGDLTAKELEEIVNGLV